MLKLVSERPSIDNRKHTLASRSESKVIMLEVRVEIALAMLSLSASLKASEDVASLVAVCRVFSRQLMEETMARAWEEEPV